MSIRDVVMDVLNPGRFFVGPGITLRWGHVPAEEIVWEIFRGQLLGPTQTRNWQIFETWNLYRIEAENESSEPILSLNLDEAAGVVHVTRAIHCHAWEGYDAGDNVFLSRETERWINELVASIELSAFPTDAELRDELAGRLFEAVVGASRLPLTSVEAPLPDFSLGRLAYFPRPGIELGPPLGSWHTVAEQMLTGAATPAEQVRIVEVVLRAASSDELPAAARILADRWQELGRSGAEFVGLLRRLFDEVALSPHTGFIDQAVGLLPLLVETTLLTAEQAFDFLGYLLRHLARHLTAYDLITFHHQGANYPDALLLDAALRAYLEGIEQSPDRVVPDDADAAPLVTRKRLRRRALRQAWLLRRFYEGLPVPDAPTSPGENQRILPPPHVRVPEEQILQPEKRTRQLYPDQPLVLGPHAGEVLQRALEDLDHPAELQELGTAVFLDRPLGVLKPPGEPDRTMLFSMEGFSRKIAVRRLDVLAEKAEGMVPTERLTEWKQRLRSLAVKGIDLPLARGPSRPGTVSLDDARKVALDFVFVRTSRRSVAEFLASFDFTPLAAVCPLDYLTPGKRVVILRGEKDGTLVVFDAEYRPRLELQVDASEGYAGRAGRGEYPVAGLHVACARTGSGEEVALAKGLRLRPRANSPS